MSEVETSTNRGPAQVIPTRTKYKIARTLSWPVGAEEVSLAVSPVSQLAELALHFRDGFREDQKRRLGIYRLIGVSYVSKPTGMNSDSIDGIPLFNRWEIIVGPVPRMLRHKVHEYILSSALPAVRDWLHQRSIRELDGSEQLTFFYNDKEERFYSETDERLMPTRQR